jgi:iron complex outermembrane receptor protein
VRVKRSANVDLYTDTGSTPLEFKDGGFEATQWTTTLDLKREIDAHMSRPVTLAIGAEQRHETYRIDAGDPASRYKAGSQSFPGFALTDAGDHSRDAYAAYVDVAANPVEPLTLDLAGRYEHYSDFGDATVGKVTARYDFSPRFALRGTASTGFRAPTLAEEFYSATNVQPNSAFVQLPPNAPAAALIGIDPLQPEKSTNYSVGLVVHPFGQALLTADAYQISVRNRVVGSGTLYGTYGGVVRSAAVNAAIIANGNVLENVPFTGINVFSNGLDTRTQGLDVVLTFPSRMAQDASIDWTFAANLNRTEVTHIKPTPPELAVSGQSLFDQVAISTLETTYPRYRLTGQGVWRQGDWSVRLRGTFYGPSQRWADPGDGNLYLDKAGAKLIADLEVSRNVGRGVSLSIGADNLFNTFPNKVNQAGLAASAAAGNPAVEIYPNFSPWGVGGGFWYVKVRKTW